MFWCESRSLCYYANEGPYAPPVGHEAFLASLDKRVLMWGVAAAMGGGLEDLRVLRGRVGSRFAGRELQ